MKKRSHKNSSELVRRHYCGSVVHNHNEYNYTIGKEPEIVPNASYGQVNLTAVLSGKVIILQV